MNTGGGTIKTKVCVPRIGFREKKTPQD